jgi:hypothetical protein
LRTRSKHLVLIMAICLVFIFPALAHAFTDIDAHWARETIEQSYEKGIVSGMPDGTFQPNKNVTRAEFATMINKAFGFNDAVTEIKFNDVKDSDWFAREVAIAVKAGYIKGYPDGTFKPQNLCTRAEASVMVRLAAGLPEGKEDALRDFKDEASIPEFARGSISALVAQGLIKGYPDGTFGPQNKITRAESLVMIYKTSIADDDDDEVKRVAVTGVELNKTSITIDEGNSYQLQATVKPADATNKKVEWTSEDEKIATVDSTGLVKGIKAGNTTITVTTEDGGFTATCSVNVTVKTPGGGGGGGGGGIDPGTFTVTLAGDAVKDTDYTVTGADDLTKVAKGTTLTITAINAITVNGEDLVAGETKEIKINANTKITINKKEAPPIDIISVEDLSDIEVAFGTPIDNIGLPNQVPVTLEDDSTIDVEVDWDNGTPAYNGEQSGEYTFTGSLVNLPEGVTNTQGLTATIKVIVAEALTEVTLELNTDTACPGDSIVATGTADANNWVSIKVLDEAGNVVFFDATRADAEGNYSLTFKVPYVAPGTLTVVAGYGDNVATKALAVTEEPVVPKDITSVEDLSDIEVAFGTPIDNIGLPNQVPVTLEDDSTIDVEVDWDNGTPAYNGEQSGEYTFTGSLVNLPEGVTNTQGLTATIKVIVAEALTEVTLELSTDTACPGDSIVATGTADANNWVSIKVLDEAGNVVFFDATRADAEGNYSLTFKVPYVAPGTLTVVAGYGDNVATKALAVTEEPVVPKDITSVEDLSDIEVAFGTPIDNIGLPNQVPVTLEDDSTIDVEVDWDNGTPAYNGEQSGEYTFTGSLVNLPEGVTNTQGLTATIKVIVAEALTEVTLELSTDTACPGDSIVATGTADANNWVSIKVVDEAGNIVFFDATRADAEGNYSLTFRVPYVAPGTLTVVAGYGDNVATKALAVTEEPVVPKDITSVEDLSDIEVAFGTPIDNIGLPNQVPVTLEDDSTIDVEVDWDNGTPAYNGEQSGEYTFTGSLVNLPEGVTNTQGLTATIKVIVAEALTEVTLELSTDTACPGDSIIATGIADANNWVSIKVVDEAGNIVFFDVTKADAEGNYSLTFKVPYVAPGTLTVVAGYGDNVATKELEVKVEVVRADGDVTQDTGKTGGTELTYNFVAAGKKLTIDANNTKLPYYEADGSTPPRTANWVGVAIPVPEGVNTEEVTATINGTECVDLFFADGKYMEYIDVKADDLAEGAATYEWVIKWGSGYADETITIELINVAGLEAPEEEPEPANLVATGSYGIHDNKVYAGYELQDKNGAQIPLVESNIESMSVKDPDGNVTDLTVVGETDPYLWFNIAKEAGTYTYTVVTKGEESKTYEATIEWTAPKEATVSFQAPAGAEAAFDSETATVDFSKVTADKLLDWTSVKDGYYAIELKIEGVDLSEGNVKYAFRVYGDGTAIEPEVKGDLDCQYVTTDWKTGLATMYYVLADGSLYQAKINVVSLTPADEPAPEVKGSIERDPANTGGELEVTIENDTVTFTSGEIKWYPEDKDLGRAAGNRVGVQINAPADFDTTGVTVKIGEQTYNWDEIKDGDGYFWWYPLVTQAGQQFTATVVWNESSTQEFKVVIGEGVTLEAAPDTTDPELKSVSPKAGDVNLEYGETFKLEVAASDENLYELEVDHNIAELPEFSVYASESDPYGGQGEAFAEAGVTVTYNAAEQKWIIDFGKAVTTKIVEKGGITFYLVLVDDAGNKWGSMDPTTPENTFAYNVTQDEAPEVSTYKFSYEVPEEVIAGKEYTVPVTFATDVKGDYGYEGVRFQFKAEGPEGATVTFKAVDSNNDEFTFTNEGYWGPAGGFDLPAEYTAPRPTGRWSSAKLAITPSLSA